MLHPTISYLTHFSEGSEYTTCTGLVFNSGGPWTKSSIFEIKAAGVSLNKIVMGKPATPGDASGFISPSTLATCVQQAKNAGWSAGVMVWQVSVLCHSIMSSSYTRLPRAVSERCGELDQDGPVPLLACISEESCTRVIVFMYFYILARFSGYGKIKRS